MDDFISNLFSALRVIGELLEGISFRINRWAFNAKQMILYGAVISSVMFWIKDISYNGLYTIKKENREKLDKGSERFG